MIALATCKPKRQENAVMHSEYNYLGCRQSGLQSVINLIEAQSLWISRKEVAAASSATPSNPCQRTALLVKRHAKSPGSTQNSQNK
jgi:hypothetical protein